MSLVTCPECKKQMSSEADACPACGYKKKKGGGCLPAIIIGAVVIGAISSLSSNNPPTTASEPAADARQSASGACMGFIKQVLHDPDSAEFGHSSAAYVNEDTPGNWTVQREVRGKNAFNAMRLSTFECKMTLNGETWHASSVKEIK